MAFSGFDPVLLQPGSSSFQDLCSALTRAGHEDLVGERSRLDDALRAANQDARRDSLAPHGTTIVAVSYRDGVMMAGDRRATMSSMIAQRDIEKVFVADELSMIGVAGTAGIAIDLARQFQVELVHYAKIEGTSLSLSGKANRLAGMLRSQLGLALHGLGVVPLFAGWDHEARRGRMFSFDLTGGCYEELSVSAVGSGSVFAKGSLKKLYRPDFDEREAALVLIQALFDAADDDSATGGPDVSRKIYPVIMSASEVGVVRLSTDQVADLTAEVLAQRLQRPDGPGAGVL